MKLALTVGFLVMSGFNVVALIEVTEQTQALVDFFRTLKSSVLATSSGWIRKTAQGRLSVCYLKDAQAYTGSYSNLEHLLTKWRRAKRAALSPFRASTPAPATTTATDPATAAAMPRAIDPVTGWLISPIVVAALCMKPHGLLTTGQAAKVAALKSALSEFVTMRWLAMRFRGIPRSKNAKRLDGWLNDAQRWHLRYAALRTHI